MTNTQPIETMTKEQVNDAIDTTDRLIATEEPWIGRDRSSDNRVRNERYWELRAYRNQLFDRLHELLVAEGHKESIETYFE